MLDMERINSIIYCRRFEKDSETIAYSPARAGEVANLIETTKTNNEVFVRLPVFVTSAYALYDLDANVTYGSNSYIVNNKPDNFCKFYIPIKDITLVQEADIDLDNH